MEKSELDYLHRVYSKGVQDDLIRLIYVDLFCGAGGTSTGVETARYQNNPCARVIACVNHDANAIASHAANHPEALHLTEDIRKLDLTQLVKYINLMRKRFVNAFVVVWASLECTNHSKAKGGVSRDADSRTLAEHLIRYIKAIDPDFLQIENVMEFMDWGPLIVKIKRDSGTGYEYCPLTIKKEGKGKNATIKYLPTMIPDPLRKGEYYNRWVNEVESCGYGFDYRTLNAADYGAYTSRKRVFGIFAKKRLPIVFPEPTHSKEAQHTLFGPLKRWKEVKEVLDFNDEGKSIFDRSCPLSPNTLDRHKAGLIKFVAGGKEKYIKKRAFLKLQTEISGHIPGMKNVQFLSKYFSGHPESKNISILGPAHTIKTKDNHALISVDFLSSYYGHGNGVRSVNMPCPTVTTKDRFDKVSCHFFDMQYGNSHCASVEGPAGTVTNNPKHSLVTCNRWLMNTNFSNIGSTVQEPAPVITANREWHYLVSIQYVSKRDCVENCSVKEEGYIPSFVKITSHEVIYEIYEDDLSVVKEIKEIMALYGIIDIKQRMLKIPELKKIMGFPENYVLIGTQADQKKFIGNAVEVNMARVLCEALCKKLKELELSPLTLKFSA